MLFILYRPHQKPSLFVPSPRRRHPKGQWVFWIQCGVSHALRAWTAYSPGGGAVGGWLKMTGQKRTQVFEHLPVST